MQTVALGILLCLAGSFVADAAQPVEKKESLEDIKKRISANLEKVTGKLKMNDPGLATVKTQNDIMKDLEELLKKKDPQSGSAAPAPSASSVGKQTSKDQPKPMNPTEEKPAGSQQNTKELSSPLKKPGVGTEHWSPQLPQTRREEMETFARDQFMRRYESELRGYYRAIAEASRRD
jgi:hypothetical protein